MQEFLQLVGELVGLHLADAVEDRAVAGEIGVLGETGIERRIVDAVELEREEDQRSGEVGDPGLHVAEELAAGGIGGVLVVPEAGVAHDPAGNGLDPLVALDRRQQSGGVEIGQPAFVIGGEGGAFGFEPVEVAGDLRRVGRGIEVAKVPFGQGAERLGGIGLAGVLGGGGGHGGSSVRVRAEIGARAAAVEAATGSPRGHIPSMIATVHFAAPRRIALTGA